MKIKKILLATVLLAFTATVQAQTYLEDPKYGNNPDERKANVELLNLFLDEYKMKNYDEALTHLYQLIEKAPLASENMYVQGIDMYRNKFLRSTSKEERSEYLDKILELFDLREAVFADHPVRGKAYLRAEKAKLYQHLSPGDRDKIFELFREAIAAGQDSVNPETVVVFFTTLTESFKMDDIPAEEYVDDYDKLVALLQANSSPEHLEAAAILENLFAGSGAANCENIEKIFGPKYEADPENPELIKKILSLFARGKCSSDFQMMLVEKYYAIDPSPEIAAMLANVYETKKDHVKALEYLNAAIAGESDPKAKANILARAAGANLSMSNDRVAGELARQAIDLDSENGAAHYLYASAASETVRKSCTGFDLQTAYWLLVDLYQRAKNYAGDDATMINNINQAINSYAGNFPKADELFMRTLNPGDSYQVNCGWLSGRTTVRAR